MSFILLIIGFVLLVKGADFFVEGSSTIAKFLKIPSIIIGLTIVAMGTSAPEAAVSIIAGINGSNDIAVSNVMGSNLFNLLVVVGISAIIKPITIQNQIIKKEYPFMLMATIVLIVMSFDVVIGNSADNMITRSEAIVLLIFMCVFMYSIISSALQSRKEAVDEETEKPKHSIPLSIVFTIGGLAGIIIGGQFVVDSAEKIALGFGMSPTLVGLTIVAVGTSLPELVTSIVAARKGESDIAVGNVVGSNIFNILFVLASSAVITPMSINALCLTDMLILIAASLFAYVFCITKNKVNRTEGIILTVTYVIYLAYAIIR
ncbi:MAG: calcium/sodium antiporter [Oscillospiraceae bacterium]|nr:calcium/sodium antiporter [Oscillospiraceae bacterium]